MYDDFQILDFFKKELLYYTKIYQFFHIIRKRKCKKMAVKNYTGEQIEKMSMLELADLILMDEKTEMKFLDLFNKVAEAKELTESQKEDLLARFYTDLNVDGRFTTLGSNVWGLKKWYPVEQTIEKSLAESRKRDAEEKALRDEFAHEEDVSEEDEEDDEDDEEKEYQDYDDLQMGEDEE